MLDMKPGVFPHANLCEEAIGARIHGPKGTSGLIHIHHIPSCPP